MFLLLERMADLTNQHPLSRPMLRTGRALMAEMEDKIRDGDFSEQSVRDKLIEFSEALHWASEAPKLIPPKLEIVPAMFRDESDNDPPGKVAYLGA